MNAEFDWDRVGIQFRCNETMAWPHRLVPEPAANLLKKQYLQPSSMDRVLRPTITCGDATGFGPDQLPTPRKVLKFRRGNANGGKGGSKAEIRKLANGVGLEIYPYTEGPHVGGGFVDLNSEPVTMRGERKRQARDSCARNDYVELTTAGHQWNPATRHTTAQKIMYSLPLNCHRQERPLTLAWAHAATIRIVAATVAPMAG